MFYREKLSIKIEVKYENRYKDLVRYLEEISKWIITNLLGSKLEKRSEIKIIKTSKIIYPDGVNNENKILEYFRKKRNNKLGKLHLDLLRNIERYYVRNLNKTMFKVIIKMERIEDSIVEIKIDIIGINKEIKNSILKLKKDLNYGNNIFIKKVKICNEKLFLNKILKRLKFIRNKK